ncbi:MAG: lysophospholipid acyltransferase family protein [Acidobacteriota bacterium]
MEQRYRRVPDWVYYFGTLPALAALPRRLSFRLARIHARRLRLTRQANFERIVTMLDSAPSLGRLSQEAREQIALHVFEKIVCEDLDAYYFPFWHAGNIAEYFKFEGLELLAESLKRGRGVLLYTAHFGSVCAPVLALSVSGYDLHQVSRDSRKDRSFPSAFQKYARFKTGWMARKMGHPLIFIDSQDGVYSPESSTASTLIAFSLLSRGQIVSMAIDVPPHLVHGNHTVDFLGRPCRFPGGLVALAEKTGAAVIPYFVVRDNRDPSRQRLIIQPEVPISGNAQPDLQAVVERSSQIIALHPEQWFAWDSFSLFWA